MWTGYMSALEFLEDERDSWRPFEALAELTDEQLERPADPSSPAHGWSGRDLMAHMIGWRELSLDAARELAVGESSPTRALVEAEFGADPDGYNARMLDASRRLGMDEVRRRFGTVPGELRGYLTVVPEGRWVKDAGMQRFFLENSLGHDAEHAADLEAILAAARGAGA